MEPLDALVAYLWTHQGRLARLLLTGGGGADVEVAAGALGPPTRSGTTNSPHELLLVELEGPSGRTLQFSRATVWDAKVDGSSISITVLGARFELEFYPPGVSSLD